MNYRHAAALALVGWYLMVPPLLPPSTQGGRSKEVIAMVDESEGSTAMTHAVAIVGIISGSLSAVSWIASALIPTPLPMAYLSGPPKWVANRIKAQSWCNGVAAAFAAIAVVCQAIFMSNVSN